MIEPKDWTADRIKLPAQEEIPHVDMQVINYHRFVLGTFHSKFVVVDRQMACVASNNIEVGRDDHTRYVSLLTIPRTTTTPK